MKTSLVNNCESRATATLGWVVRLMEDEETSIFVAEKLARPA